MDRYLTKDEQDRLLNAAKRVHDPLAQRDYHIMAALLLSGCRVGEFTRITIGAAIDAVHTGALYIPAEDRKGKKRDHRIPLTDALKKHFTWLLSMVAEGHISEPLIAGPSGKPITVRQIQMRLKIWVKEAGLVEEVSPHWLRHSRAMNVMASSTAKDPRGIVKQLLGHASVATTGVYTETNKADVLATLEEIDAPKRTRRPTLSELRKQFAEVRS